MKDRKLTNNDIVWLLALGYSKQDLPQIAYSYSKIECYSVNSKNKKKKEIKPSTIIRKIGKKQFLSMLGRASFHHSTSYNYHDKLSYEVVDNIPMFTDIPNEFFKDFNF